MVCLPRIKRVLSASVAAMLLLGGGWCGSQGVAQARSGYSTSQSADLLGVVSVSGSPDGDGLLIHANRVFSVDETRNFSFLRLPSPYRVVMDIPNARLNATSRVIPVQQNGIDRVELSDNSSPFYSSVRISVFVQDGQTLARLSPVFVGNTLHLSGIAVAGLPVALPAGAVVPAEPLVSSSIHAAPVASSKREGRSRRNIRPLPPEVKPTSALVAKKSVPVPPVAPLANDAETTRSGLAAVAAGGETILGTPAPAGSAVVENIEFRDNHLLLKSNAGSELHVKNRFVLTAPSRVVMDLENAVLKGRQLLTPIAGNSSELHQIRVGQFDEKTVRVVIESTEPEQLESYYPASERNILAISSDSSTSITKLSANTRLGEVQSIDLKRDNGGMVLRLTASAPIVHRLIKKDDRLIIDLLNEAARPSPIGFDARQYPEIEKMRLEPLTDGQPNSKLFIQLNNANTRVMPTLSADGKTMELLISNEGATEGPASSLANLAGLGAAGKAPFAARIVVDAGHGGKDIGATRSGVQEKDLNLSLALMVRDALVAKGFKVYMTRSTDVFLPLPQITAITNQIHPDLFISIHHNASVNPALNGIETYYYTPQSIALARRVHVRNINAVGVRDGGVKQARFYVIHHTDVPAILCEVGYVSNPAELDSLQGMDRKTRTARAIADGVVDYLKSRTSANAR